MESRPLSELLGGIDALAAEREALERRIAEIDQEARDTLRAARFAANVSQETLSMTSGTSQPYLSQIENGGRAATPSTLRGLSKALAQTSKTGGKSGKDADQIGEAQKRQVRRRK